MGCTGDVRKMNIEPVIGIIGALSGVVIGAVLQPIVNSASIDRESRRHLEALAKRFVFCFINLTIDLEVDGHIYEHNLKRTENIARKLIKEIPSSNSASHAHLVAWELLNSALRQRDSSLRKQTYYHHAAETLVKHYRWKKAKSLNEIHNRVDEASRAAHSDKLHYDLEGLDEGRPHDGVGPR